MKIAYMHDPAVIRTGAAAAIRRALTAWLLAAGAELLLSPGDLARLDTVAGLSAVRMLAVGGVVFAMLWTAERWLGRGARWLLAGAFALLTVASLVQSFTLPFAAACLLMLAGAAGYACKGWAAGPGGSPVRPAGQRGNKFLAAVIGAGLFLFVGVWTVCRVYGFRSPTFDFTIFAQMFHNMKETGLPMTTVERDGLLSHFDVHVSPIYYLMLPLYCLAPYPVTLQILQAAVMASALIPLWKLGRHHGLAPWQRCLLCLVLALYPAYGGGAGYDIHENAFLTPLILWLFYGLDRRSVPLTAVFGLLTCMVKEDAAVYVAVIALWQLIQGVLRRDRTWNLAAGAALLVGSVAWFLAATGYLARSGDGVMTYRYDNFMYDDSDSLLTVIKAALLCPMKVLYECVNPQKLSYIGLTMGPLLGLPLLTRRYERYILLIPYLLVNLMTDYQYQYHIFYQYSFGSAACLLYLTLVNLADWQPRKRHVLGAMAVVSALCFGLTVAPKAMSYPQYCMSYSQTLAQRWELLDTIPEDAAVAATTFYTAPLANRETLYDIRYGSREHILECEYVVVSLTDTTSFKKYASGGTDGRERFLLFLEQNGYEVFARLEKQIVIYKR